jgi:hypothetical protein
VLVCYTDQLSFYQYGKDVPEKDLDLAGEVIAYTLMDV